MSGKARSNKGRHMGGVHTLDDVRARCEEVGDCWEWQRAINSERVPQVHCNGMPRPARRVAWEMVNGPVPTGMVVTNRHSCKNFRCVNPAHSKAVAAKVVLTANLQGANNAARKAKIAATKRKQMGVGADVVAAVRADASATKASDLAIDLGVSEATIYKLRRQALAASPFAGLMRGVA